MQGDDAMQTGGIRLKYHFPEILSITGMALNETGTEGNGVGV
jgi:hypothetical protein